MKTVGNDMSASGAVGAETVEERKRRYSDTRTQRQRQMRVQRRKEKAENMTDSRRLAFIIKAMDATGTTKRDLTKRIGINKQMLFYYFDTRDNCKLSVARKILEAIGYNLTYEIKASGRGVKPHILLDESEMPEPVKAASHGDRLLTPLAKFLMEREYSSTMLERNTGLQRGILHQMFIRDDIAIDRLIDLVGAYQYHILWRMTPVADGKEITFETGEPSARKPEITYSTKGKNSAAKKWQEPEENTTRLGFIKAAMRQEHATQAELAARLGVFPQSVNAVFQRDDMLLSDSKRYLAALGYDVDFGFTGGPESREIVMETSETAYPESLRNAFGGPLDALARLIALSGTDMSRFADKTGIPRSTLRLDLLNGDCKISRIEQAGSAYGLRLQWFVRKKKDAGSVEY